MSAGELIATVKYRLGLSFLGALVTRISPPYKHEQCELKGCVQLLNGAEK